MNAKSGSVRALMALNFCIADVQNGMGPYVALFGQEPTNDDARGVGEWRMRRMERQIAILEHTARRFPRCRPSLEDGKPPD